MASGDSPIRPATISVRARRAANLERRSRLHRLDDLLEALEALNLRDSRVLSAAVSAMLDELGIPSASTGAPFTTLIDGVFAAQEQLMIQLPGDLYPRLRRAPFDPTKLRI